MRLLLLGLLAWAGVAGAQVGSFDWTAVPETFPGTKLAAVSVTSPRRMDVFCLRLDGDWVDFRTTRRAPSWVAGSTETIRKTTRNFLRERRAAGEPLLAGINADGFQPWPAPWDQELPTDLTGLAVADGVLVSPATAEPSFVVYDDGTMAITPGLADLTGVATAVSGFGYVLAGGVPLAGGAAVHPRTGVGLSADARVAYFLVIDGRRHATEGATTGEVGQWLLHFGAHDGLNMDGGGSSTMARFDPAAPGDGVVLINQPVGNGIDWLDFDPAIEAQYFAPSERANGNNLGVLAAPDRDADALPDRAEITAGSNPDLPDSDGDGVTDGLEVARGTDPTVALPCPPAPRADCREPTRPGAAFLALKDAPRGDRLVWRWRAGDETTEAALGDPRSTTAYVACVYDASAGSQPVVRALLPAAGACGRPDCWTPRRSGGFVYDAPGGVRRATLFPGPAGRAKIALRGSDTYVGQPGPLLPLVPPVRVQLVNSDNQCWSATYSDPSASSERVFRARSD